MCTPVIFPAIGLATDLVLGFGKEALEAKQERKNLEYKTQIALNNAAKAKSQALQQQQLGIEASRKEKIEGLRKANLQAAKRSSGGFDMSSMTNQQNYTDTIDNANSQAQDTKDQYNLRADSYFDQANDYLNNIDQYNSNYNDSLYKTALNSLGTVKSVANKWYK